MSLEPFHRSPRSHGCGRQRPRYSVASDAQRTESTLGKAGSLVPRLARNLTQYRGQIDPLRPGAKASAGGNERRRTAQDRGLAPGGAGPEGWRVPSRRLLEWLDPHDLDVDAPRSRPVQLGEQDRLELPERQLTPADPERHAPSQQRRTEMRGGIAPLAVRIAGVVVLVAGVVDHQPFQHGLEIFHEGALKLVHEDVARRVEGVDEQDALLDVCAQHDVPDLLRDVDDLGALFAQHREGLANYLLGLHRDGLHGPGLSDAFRPNRLRVASGAEGGNRTPTALADQRILSPLRLPVPPPRPEKPPSTEYGGGERIRTAE